ncbi:hypothetical protein [uncultured Methanoregula sp.]|uniref:hypothetical protein n=1 Tax=uncultured Methanoregula sp. TaxID=1005933 RepID=UPI002AAB0FE9|nr:hypothetical protein [uncultured Methanoregula sp.]
MERAAVLTLVVVLTIFMSGCIQAPANPQETSVRIDAVPSVYSPLMSSTPGIGLTPNVTGFGISGARYEWNASYGRFLDWSAPGYVISEHGLSATSNGETIYWSFYTFPESSPPPVVVTLNAIDKKTGRVLGNSRMMLGWEQNNTFVRIERIE